MKPKHYHCLCCKRTFSKRSGYTAHSLAHVRRGELEAVLVARTEQGNTTAQTRYEFRKVEE